MKSKIAFLILAHANTSQLEKLCTRLSEDFDVYTHIDKKAPYQLYDVARKVSFHAQQRYSISWGSFEMVLATLSLLREANTRGYSRYVLLSGMDAPLVANSEIADFFAKHNDRDFITSISLDHWDRGGRERVTRFHGKSPVGTSGFLRVQRLLFGKTLDTVQSLFPINRGMDWEFFCGSQWFNLTGNSVTKLLGYLDQHPEFTKRFKFTACSDEIFFQTALHQCGLGESQINDNLRHIDWFSGPEFPRILRDSDLPELKASAALFARKFDERLDANVIEAIYSTTATRKN